MRWGPTLWGWLLILAALAVLVAAAGFAVFRGAYGFLAPTAPLAADGGPAPQVLIVEGWLSEQDLDVAIDAIRGSPYRAIVTSGGPIETFSRYATYAERAADYLRAHGVSDRPVLAAPAPASAQERTFLSAVVARDAIRAQGWDAQRVDVYTLGAHTRRTWFLYRRAFGDEARVGIIGADPQLYDAQRWWTSSVGFKTIVGELISITWTWCCFEPGEPGSHAERWGPANARIPPAARGAAEREASAPANAGVRR